MLQQTQVDRVVPHYERFLAAFPTPAACAAAGPAAVVRLWSGLGYNRRALNLHRAAAAMVADHGGAVPHEDAALRALPGVGPYTARAVRTFAFGDDVAAVDTNGVRVLARGVAGAALTVRQAMALGDRLVPAGRVVGVQPGDVRPRRHRVHRGATRLRAVPAAPPVRLAAPGLATEPDPWRLSPTARPQSTFAGSDRQGRGRLLDALRARRRAAERPGRPPAAGPTTRRGPSGWRPPWWRRGSPRGPAGRIRSSGCARGRAARRPRPRRRRQEAVRKSTMWRLTTSGRSTCRKWPASSTTSTAEPSARKSSGEPMDDSSMQLSSRPWR